MQIGALEHPVLSMHCWSDALAGTCTEDLEIDMLDKHALLVICTGREWKTAGQDLAGVSMARQLAQAILVSSHFIGTSLLHGTSCVS